MIGVEGARLLRDKLAGETLKSVTYECGSPPAPRKASSLERKSTLSRTSKIEKTTFLYVNEKKSFCLGRSS
ncbi:hypothetical protein P8610_19775 [Fictibacillus sp. UD]